MVSGNVARFKKKEKSPGPGNRTRVSSPLSEPDPLHDSFTVVIWRATTAPARVLVATWRPQLDHMALRSIARNPDPDSPGCAMNIGSRPSFPLTRLSCLVGKLKSNLSRKFFVNIPIVVVRWPEAFAAIVSSQPMATPSCWPVNPTPSVRE